MESILGIRFLSVGKRRSMDNKRELLDKTETLGTYLERLLKDDENYLVKELTRRLEIQAGSISEAEDFVKQTLIDIAQENSYVSDHKNIKQRLEELR